MFEELFYCALGLFILLCLWGFVDEALSGDRPNENRYDPD